MGGKNSSLENQPSHVDDRDLYQSQTSILAIWMRQFHTAVKQGEESAVLAILKTGINIDAPNENGLTALIIAVFQENQSMIKLLLEHGASISTRSVGPKYYYFSEPKWTVLHYAVKFSTDEIVHLLLTVKPNLEFISSELFNRLINCTGQQGNSTIINHLLRGKDISKFNLNCPVHEYISTKETPAIDLWALCKYCPLFLAIKTKRFKVVEWLLKSGAHFHKISEYYDSTHQFTFESFSLLHMAVLSYRGEQDDKLIRLYCNYFDVNETTGCGFTALGIAIWHRKLELAKLLINLGADINKKSNGFIKDHSPLRVIICYLEVSMLEFILNTNKVSYENLESVLTDIDSLTLNRAVPILRYIRYKFQFPESECLTLHLAIKCNDQKVIDYFCSHKPNVHLMKWQGMFPIHRAVTCINIDCLIRLLDLEADIDMEDETCRFFTALEYAIKNGNVTLISFLLNKGANVDRFKMAPPDVIHYAILYESSEFLELLLDAGVRIQSDSYKNLRSYPSWYIILDVLRRRNIKLRAANMAIDSDYMNDDTLFSSKLEERSFYRKCIKEIDKLKKEMISETNIVSYHHFLTGNTRRIANYTRNYDITSRFIPEQVEDKFPIYGRIIITSFHRAFKHSQLIQNVESLLSDLFYDLPFVFICNVPTYLSDDELRFLVTS